MKSYHFIIPKGFSLYKNSSIIYQTHVYIEYYNWMHYGHPLAEKIARISVQMDMAGETTIPDMLQLLHLKLEMVKDLTLTTKEHIAELEAEIRFWNELGEELVANGSKVTDCKIEYQIAEKGLD